MSVKFVEGEGDWVVHPNFLPLHFNTPFSSCFTKSLFEVIRGSVNSFFLAALLGKIEKIFSKRGAIAPSPLPLNPPLLH
jgi:hypothetical protein